MKLTHFFYHVQKSVPQRMLFLKVALNVEHSFNIIIHFNQISLVLNLKISFKKEFYHCEI